MPLSSAALNGFLEIVQFLVEQGANIHASNDEALCSSSGHNHIEIVRFLLSKGANIYVRDDLPLCSAAHGGHLEIVKMLVQAGADIHAGGDTPLVNSVKNGHLSVVQYLIEQGSDLKLAIQIAQTAEFPFVKGLEVRRKELLDWLVVSFGKDALDQTPNYPSQSKKRF